MRPWTEPRPRVPPCCVDDECWLRAFVSYLTVRVPTACANHRYRVEWKVAGSVALGIRLAFGIQAGSGGRLGYNTHK